MADSGYIEGTAPASAPAVATIAAPAVDHEQLKKDYLAYLDNKSDEIKEQKDSRRYYHGSQWSEKATRAFQRRRQPVVTYNREAKKINAIIGLLERQRQDPRAFPRTPKQEDGAEIATATVRYVVDAGRWKEKSPISALNGAVDGVGGVEIVIEPGDQGDPDVGFENVEPSSFFYDPRSLKADFSDARYMGVAKWADIEAAIEMFPDKEDELHASIEAGEELTSNPDSDGKWISGNEKSRKVRIVDHWYIKGGEWRWCLYTGDVMLADGESYLRDEKDRTICKYIMFSANVDQDGDRYGFHRGMKSAQDEINQRRSKALHLLNSRRMIIEEGSVANVDKTRLEAVKPDGVIVYNTGMQKPEFEDAAKNAELQGQLGFLEDAKNEIDNYGFNPALMGSGVSDMSGRAIQLQQQAGIAELGPYLLAWKGWKLRVYRAIWGAIQQHWTAERWIRVTDDENLAQFFAVNQQGIDPQTGQPALINALGSLDVDIIIDEGPDEINMQADAYDTLSIMAQKGQGVPPELLIELSPLTGSVKKKALDILQKASQNPMQSAAVQIEMQGKAADNAKTEAETAKIVAETQNLGAGEDPRPKMMDAELRLQDGRQRLAATAAKSEADQVKAGLDIASKRIDLAGKEIDLQRQREAPPPQPPVAQQ